MTRIPSRTNPKGARSNTFTCQLCDCTSHVHLLYTEIVVTWTYEDLFSFVIKAFDFKEAIAFETWRIKSSELETGRVKKLQKFIKFCIKAGHGANLKHSKSTWRQLIALWKLQNRDIEISGHSARSPLLERRDVWGRSIYEIVVLISGALVWAD